MNTLIKKSNLNKKCEKCKFECVTIHLQQNFKNWTSGNECIDKFIQDTQLLAHDDAKKALEWIPYDRFYNIKYLEKIGVTVANWIDGCIDEWDNENQNWKKKCQNMFVILKNFNDSKNITLKFMSENNRLYGITQDPKTKNYMVVFSDECEICNYICNAIHFQRNFKNWTSGNDYIDKFIRNTQLSVHKNHEVFKNALEWIPYDRLYNIKYIANYEIGKMYRANWIDGYIGYWNDENQNWRRFCQNTFVTLKSLINPEYINLEFMNKIKTDYEFYGITQNPQTKNYMMVLNDKCKKCNYVCSAIHFKQNFENWTSGNDDIDEFIQNIQLSVHKYDYNVFKKPLEWIPYDKFYDIEYIERGEIGKVYGANWIDGPIREWDDKIFNWERNRNVLVVLKHLNHLKNIASEVKNEITKPYGITQEPQTKNYMMVLSDKCKKCNYICNAIHFQQNFESWTSGNDDIDEFIQNTQISAHDDAKALEWIPYDKFYDIEYIERGEIRKVYGANWIDGPIREWDDKIFNWERNRNVLVVLKHLNNLKNIASEVENEITKPYGITQEPQTKNYMMVLSDKCKKCNYICNAIHFQQNFESWTSGHDDIDEFIQNTQISAHDDAKALEWITYDRFYDIKYIEEIGIYKAIWIDERIDKWDSKNRNWIRFNQNMFVDLKVLNYPKNIAIELTNKNNRLYGITQDPKTKNYMVVLSDECEICNYICEAIHFQRDFKNWTSGNDYIDKFIQNTQISAHGDAEALEWITYDRLYDIKYIANYEIGKLHRANWIDIGYIGYWNDKSQNWRRFCQNTFVTLKSLINPEYINLEFMNKIKTDYEFYGITQNPQTKNYMMVLNDKCKKCNFTCSVIHFKQNFENWTSGNNDIDEFIQNIQLSTHKYYDVFKKPLEWIPYDKFYDIERGEIGKVYSANWIDGPIREWDNKIFNWERNQNVLVVLKHLNNLKNIASEVKNEVILHKIYGITQEPETKNYMMVLNYICKKCNYECKTIHFQGKFKNWTSGNNNIDKFIQDTQLLAHDISDALEWISYDRFNNIEYIAKGGFAKVYKAYWSSKSKFVALKILNNSKNITLEFMNEIMLHYKVDMSDKIIKFYGITQEPETKNYGMVLDYAENGSLRNFLNMTQSNHVHGKLDWYNKLKYLWIIAYGLSFIHRNELIHRDLHIGNILHTGNDVKITDVGLCKPANCDTQKNHIYGNLPYVAPEILRGKNYTKAADIYSFGIVMYEVISELSPYHDLNHEENLTIKICQGLRPRFNIKVPELIIHLIKRCLDANPSKRPTAYEIYKILRNWCDNRVTELQKQIKESEEINNKLVTDGILRETNSEAIYTSRLLSFDNLPKAKNSDDYYKYKDNIISVEFSASLSQQILSEPKYSDYEQNNDIINMEHSESLQIDISQLNININEDGEL